MSCISRYFKTVYFKSGGEENTTQLLLNTHEYINNYDENFNYIIISSTTGYTAFEGIKAFKNFNIPMIICMQDLNEEFSMKKDVQDKLRCYCEMISIPRNYLSNLIGKNTCNILRNFSQGTKVCIELLMYLIDISKIKVGDKVIILGGTLRGADTAISFEVKPQKGFKVLNIIGFPEK